MAPQTRSSRRARAQPEAKEPREPSMPSVSSDYGTLEIAVVAVNQGPDPGVDGVSSTEDLELDTSKSKPSKRLRKTHQDPGAPTHSMIKRARGKQGKLQGLMNMPIEVFTEDDDKRMLDLTTVILDLEVSLSARLDLAVTSEQVLPPAAYVSVGNPDMETRSK
ncbi:hypothetical protein FRC09_013879 [Ceratobasidium sp. 395]|nr:hypothetical protein FRC09_013879 [Ceratobasidium sp. 395]